MARKRLDSLLAERGLAPSRSAAASAVRAGMVRVGRGEARASKPSQLVAEDATVRVEGGRRFVSRGGLKLEAALDRLEIGVDGLNCLDVGASTGGFTDCLLQRGAGRVACVDVGRGQLDWSLRNDPRVVAYEGINARDLEPEALPFAAELAVIDVSFISLGKLLGAVTACLSEGGEILAMVKPQFELGRGRVKGGVVRSPVERREAVDSVLVAAEELGLGLGGAAEAGVAGPKGNREVFLRLGRRYDPAAAAREGLLAEAVT